MSSSLQWTQYSQMSNNTVLKSGWLNKLSKGFMGEKWKKVYVNLYKDSSLFWFKNKGDATSKGNVNLKTVCKYLTCGANVRAIPYSPATPDWASVDHMIAFPQQPSKKSQVFFFLCTDQAEFDAWMNVIVSTLPPPPTQQQQPTGQAAPPPAARPPAYAPISQHPPPPPAMAPGYPQPPSNAPFYPQPQPPQPGGVIGGGIGFESLAMPTPPPPGQQPYLPPGGASPYPVAPPLPHQGGYAPPPAAAYPQQPAPSYPQQGYLQPGAAAAYPTQQQQQSQYQPYPTQQQGHAAPQPSYQPVAGGGYVHHQQQPGYAQQQPMTYGAGVSPVGAQTVVYKNKPKKSKGTGKMIAGLAGGAVAGYAASRIFSPFGGHGWGHGSWGSGSWGSFSGGSFGSFGSFGGD